MRRTINEDIKTLETYKKEEILEALKHADRYKLYHVDLITADMVSYLENKKRDEVFAARDKATGAKMEAIKAFQEWKAEMCEKYGDGMSVKLAVLPPDEIERGAALEKKIKEAVKKAQRLDAQIERLLKI